MESFTLQSAQEHAIKVARGGTSVLDVSQLIHDQARHAEMTTLAALGWWLLSTDVELGGRVLRVPKVLSSPYLPLVRSGLVTAAVLREMEVVGPEGDPIDPVALTLGRRPVGQDSLPGADWTVRDELAGGGRLRIMPDLADPRRAPRRDPRLRFSYPWLSKLGLFSPAITPSDYQRFVSDADRVLRELIDNVHRWSRASSAYAVISTTRGPSEGSWNRLHVVIADAGIGIPEALREDLLALVAVYGASGDPAPLDDLSDGDLLERLMRHAFGGRQIPNHNGHGLNFAQSRSGRWVGALDIITVGVDGKVIRRASRGVNPNSYEADDGIDLPGARGTLVHLLLQATSAEHRRDAAEHEQLSFNEDADAEASSAPPSNAHA